MRTSSLLLATVKEVPSDAQLISHQLMLRAGMIRKLASGLYTWLPLGLKVLRKVEKVIRKHMEAAGVQEILMPAIQPAQLWEETGRWETFGPQLLCLTDRHQREFCFGPTHEEVITDLMRNELRSYKQLPTCFYQIQTKFRDEIRPRFGVMRAREFLMKDAYSFNLNEHDLQETYDQMFKAYQGIFTDLGLKFRSVLADTGAIGGSVSHEFHVLADSGEDALAYCPESEYAANVEMAQAKREAPPSQEGKESLNQCVTPGIKTVEAQAQHMGLETKQILKTLLVKGTHTPVVALMVRGDHQLNPLKAEKLDEVASPFSLIDVREVEETAKCSPGFVGPKGLEVPMFADFDVLNMRDFSCGANQNDTHFVGFNWGRDCKQPIGVDLREVREGDLSPDGKGVLNICRGIEVGHIFQLGDKYSRAMNATVLDEKGRNIHPLMGCYGIGVSRIVAAAIEQNHDEKGIIWPKIMAPFEVAIIPMNFHKSKRIQETVETLYAQCLELGFEVLLDDRKERPGVMFADMELIGIPYHIIVGERNLDQGKVELKNRQNGQTTLEPIDAILSLLGVPSKKQC